MVILNKRKTEQLPVLPEEYYIIQVFEDEPVRYLVKKQSTLQEAIKKVQLSEEAY